MAVKGTHAWAMDGNIAAMEADLALGSAPAVAHAASTAAMPRTSEPLCILAQHLLDGSNPGRQTEALERTVHISPSHLKAGYERERRRHANGRHGVALLCGFD